MGRKNARSKQQKTDKPDDSINQVAIPIAPPNPHVVAGAYRHYTRAEKVASDMQERMGPDLGEQLINNNRLLRYKLSQLVDLSDQIALQSNRIFDRSVLALTPAIRQRLIQKDLDVCSKAVHQLTPRSRVLVQNLLADSIDEFHRREVSSSSYADPVTLHQDPTRDSHIPPRDYLGDLSQPRDYLGCRDMISIVIQALSTIPGVPYSQGMGSRIVDGIIQMGLTLRSRDTPD